MTATAGSVSGTRWVVLQGGPPEWDGHTTAVANDSRPAAAPLSMLGRAPEPAPRRLQRWCHTSDLIAEWERTGSEQDIEVPRHTREGGTKIVTAEVWVFVGYRGEPGCS